MFVTNWISTTKIQKISEITNFFRHYFLSRTEVNYHKTSFWDYENEKMNDYDNWSDPFGDERAFYDGWSREDVESGLADAYE